jgi:hypothetical protein
MTYMLDYIKKLEPANLKANELSQCLLYLEYVCRHKPELKEPVATIKARLSVRLQELRNIKKGS